MEKIYKGEIQRLLPIFQAMADGMIIQFAANGNDWIDIDGEEEGLFLETLIDNPQYYRIKPEQKFRPFKDAEECWQEIRKHEPFIKYKVMKSSKDVYLIIQRIKIDGIETDVERLDFETAFEWFTFSDGTPFGVKVEE